MILPRLCLLLLPLLPLIGHCAAPERDDAYKAETTAGLEEIYVFRTSRTTRTRGNTPPCGQAGFESNAEDFYQLWSIAVNAKSSRLTDGHVRSVGGFTACFGALAPNQPFKMFASGDVAQLHWSGRGECVPMSAQPPDIKVRAFNCNLALDQLPDGYASGWLTSSTLAPVLGPTASPDAHVPGYLSTSVVTLRLWKTPGAAAKDAQK